MTLDPLTRLIMIAEELTAADDTNTPVDPNHAAAMAAVLVEVHDSLDALGREIRHQAEKFGLAAAPVSQPDHLDMPSWRLGQSQGHADAEAAMLNLAEFHRNRSETAK